FMRHGGRILASGTPDDLRANARGLTGVALPPPGLPARALQARLIDAHHLIVDAVPRCGAVWFVRKPNADNTQVKALLGDVTHHPRHEVLEDALMLLLSTHQHAADHHPPTPSVAPQTTEQQR